jgi:hypothetical protein
VKWKFCLGGIPRLFLKTTIRVVKTLWRCRLTAFLFCFVLPWQFE